jgi:phosphoribosylformimino-5-aminoimidazole carboxamide ribotide isomerase
MIAIPAIDLRDGCCVQLVGGSFDDERVRIADPVGVARRWIDAGFTRLHVVDLDAATGRGSNAAVVEKLASQPGLDTQVGGGLRDTSTIEAVLASGARRAVVGTRALKDREWLGSIVNAWPGRIVVAADARNGAAVTDGWAASLGRDVLEVIDELNTLALAGVLVTAVDREGQMAGPDVELIARAVARSRHPVIASGGVASIDDLRKLEQVGAGAVVIGMALYSGALDERAVAREFAA